MPFTAPTIDAFKTQFDRDFRYASPSFGALVAGTVLTGAIASLQIVAPGQFYQNPPTLQIADPAGSGASATLTVANGAVTGYANLLPGSGYVSPVFTVVSADGDPTDRKRVRDLDIARAQQAALINSNQSLWPDQATWNYVMNLLAAHYLCRNFLQSAQGLGGQGEWLHASKSVGDISAGFDIPERIKKSAILAPISKTSYGMQYLELLMPNLQAGAFASPRMSSPW